MYTIVHKHFFFFFILYLFFRLKKKEEITLTALIEENLLFEKYVLDEIINYEYNNYNKICIGKYIKKIRCHCIIRISLLLNMIDKNINYINYNNNNNKNNDIITRIIYDTFGKYYNIISILNDYIHIIKYHDNILQDIYKYINIKSCKLNTCKYIKRNYRNKINENNNNKNNNNDNKSELINNIIDIIHCYLIHTFDIGFKLTQNEKDLISFDNDDEEEYIDDDNSTIYNGNDNKSDSGLSNTIKIEYGFITLKSLLKQKRISYKNIIGAFDRIIYTKFITKIDDKKENEYNNNNNNNINDDIIYKKKKKNYYYLNFVIIFIIGKNIKINKYLILKIQDIDIVIYIYQQNI